MTETLKNLLNSLVDWITHAGINLVIALLVIVIGMSLVKFINKRLAKAKSFSKLDPSVNSFLKNCIKIALYAIVFVSAALIIGIPAASLIALLGTAGVAIGLALQGAFSNFAGGIMILIFRPFKIGDYIDTVGHSGTVKEISIFYTVLKTPDNKTITIPNGTLMNSSVINYSVENTRRIDIDFAISPKNDIESVKEIMLECANSHELVLQDNPPFARNTGRDNGALIFTLRVWAKSENFWDVKFDLTEKIKNEFDNKGVLAFHHQVDVHNQ
ncbi:MAG: mechanosensitive ion channel [Clostridia bacterium]|nr:mechanosensitive ion channel [Clostridia bacterium]